MFKNATSETYNTNNAWGFGGGIGIKYTLPDGHTIKIGTAYFRHLDPEKYVTITTPEGKRVFDELKTTKNLTTAVKLLETFYS